MLHLATSVARPNLVSLGTCFGKFSKTGKFKLGITSLDWLAKYAKYKVSPQRAGGVTLGGMREVLLEDLPEGLLPREECWGGWRLLLRASLM
jgi:hypothetical protein